MGSIFLDSTPKMKSPLFFLSTFLSFAAAGLAADVRLEALKDLNGYFPFTPPSDLKSWESRKAEVQRRILVSQGLWPMPTKTPLNAVIHGKVECEDYTVEKVYFQSAPGLFVTGNLYRPKNVHGKVPGIMFAHGHWTDARLSSQPEDKLRAEIASGAERFASGGKSRFQSMCVQLARMGCVVWQWDMLSDSDALQFSRDVIHGFATQRPEMNTVADWGLFSPQAEAHLQSVMGLHTWNAVRGLDFLLSLPEVDPERTAITGSSGGGTQTMMLAAIDDRIKLSFPVVMVSTAMQGGCSCENASLLRLNTGNVEFAALCAPRPQGMNTANDWTKEMASKGFPELQALYGLYGKKENVFLERGEHFPHNYNAVTRSAFYTFLNKHFQLGQSSPVIEHDYQPLSREQLTVWDKQHPAPKAADPDFERSLLKWFNADAETQLKNCAATSDGRERVIRPAVETLIGRTFAEVGEVAWEPSTKLDRGEYLEMSGLVTNRTFKEEIAVTFLYPKKQNDRAVIWLDDTGKAALFGAGGSLNQEVRRLVEQGITVIGADLLLQTSGVSEPTRTVNSKRQVPSYTFGYNHSLFAQRTHDVLTLVKFVQAAKVGSHVNPTTVSVVGWNTAGPITLAARCIAGSSIARAAADTQGFRFGKLLDYRDASFLPGGAKYLDIPGMVALNASLPLWLAGEAPETLVGQLPTVMEVRSEGAIKQASAVSWLLRE